MWLQTLRPVLYCAALVLLAGCEARILPSRAIEVGPVDGLRNANELIEIIEKELLAMGFIREGAGGYEELTGERLLVSYRRGDVSVSVSNRIPSLIRINDHGSQFGSEAQSVQNSIRDLVNAKWPNAVQDVL